MGTQSLPHMQERRVQTVRYRRWTPPKEYNVRRWPKPHDVAMDDFSREDRIVIELTMRGYRPAAIAQQLGISTSGVMYKLKNILLRIPDYGVFGRPAVLQIAHWYWAKGNGQTDKV